MINDDEIHSGVLTAFFFFICSLQAFMAALCVDGKGKCCSSYNTQILHDVAKNPATKKIIDLSFVPPQQTNKGKD